MSHFELRWGIYKKQRGLKNSEPFQKHLFDYLKFYKRLFEEWEEIQDIERFSTVENRDERFDSWIKFKFGKGK